MTAPRNIPRLLTVADSADAAGVSVWTIRQELKARRLKASRVHGCLRVLDEDLAAWLRSRPADVEHGGKRDDQATESA